MYPEYPNLYQRARKATYFSQEEAAELIGLSAESMKQYESGRRVPSDDTVHRMAELYNLPWLELEHAKATLANRFRRASDQIYTLLEIAEDGIIDECERPEFDAIVADLRETIAAAYQVIYADGAKKERPDGGTSKRSCSQRFESENDCKNSIAYSRGNASPVLTKGVYAR